ncbi:MAG: zinc ribbon domain-containing protein [Oscillospiraceae bacterium]
MKTCPNCGAVLDDDTRFCTNCGYQFQDQGNQNQYGQQPQQPQQPQYSQYNAQYQQPVQQYAPVEPNTPNHGLALASMILGILALCTSATLPCAIISLVLGGKATRGPRLSGRESSWARAGKICSWIAIALMVLYMIIFFSAIGSVTSIVKDILEEFQNGSYSYNW